MKLKFEEYLKEIEDFYLKQKGVFSFLSPKELDLIKNWYKQDIPLDLIKETIKKEIVKFPERKKKKFSLILIDKLLQENRYEKDENIDEKWKKILGVFNIPAEKFNNLKTDIEKENFIVSYIWKNMLKEEKEKLINEAVSNIDKKGLSKKEYEELIKSYIYTKILNYIETI